MANMFLIPLGMMRGAEVTVADFLLKNLLPVTLGNIVGGSFCVSALYASVFGSPKEEPAERQQLPSSSTAIAMRGGYCPPAASSNQRPCTSFLSRIRAAVMGRGKGRQRLNEKLTGSDYLSAEALEKAKEGNMFEKVKLKKDGSAMWTEVHEYAAAIRSGQINWFETTRPLSSNALRIVILIFSFGQDGHCQRRYGHPSEVRGHVP